MRCIIFSAASFSDAPSIMDDDYVICADGGYLRAAELGVIPDVILGDFDSAPFPKDAACEVIVTPSEKDDTDTMLAVRLAIERGYDYIMLYGGLGGRLDHTVANLQAAVFAKENGASLTLVGDKNTAFIIENETVRLPKKDGYLSVFSYSNECSGVTESGVKYPLNNATLKSGMPIGVSNEILADFCEISVEKGKLLIIISRD